MPTCATARPLESRVRRKGAPWHALRELPPQVAEVQGMDFEADDLPGPERARGQEPVMKRGAAEDVYAAALQRLSDRARAALPEPQCPAAEPHARR